MNGILSALIILTSLLLVLVVLVQNSKGGGLSSTFSASNQVMGVRKTADFLEKSTWTLVAVLVVLCMASTVSSTSASDPEQETVSQKKAADAPAAPAAAPARPAPGAAPGTPAPAK